MFWIRFIIGGFLIALVAWVAGYVNNRVAGYLVAVPIMFTLSFLFQYLAHGNKTTIELVQGTLFALPALVVFGLISIYALWHDMPIAPTLIASFLGWIISVLIINQLVA